MSQIIIREGAIFIADAHANENRREFLQFLKDIKSGKISTNQLFLLGDIFDFISQQTDYFIEFFSEELRLLNEISTDLEIYYFEGNHDYNLAELFKNIKIYPIKSQPVKFQTPNGKSVSIAHGDIFLPFFTKYLLLFLRTNLFLRVLNQIDKFLNRKISKQILQNLSRKKLDYKIENFIQIAKQRCLFYESDIIIEGHFHQGEIFNFTKPREQIYINIASFACEQRFFIVKYDEQKFSLSKMDARGQNV